MGLKLRHTVASITLLIGSTLSLLGHTQPADTSLEPSGFAIYSDFSVEKFVTGLYLTPSSANQPRALNNEFERKLEFRFIDDMSQRSFLRIIQQNAAINNPQEILNNNEKALAAFNKQFKGGFVQGDQLALITDSNQRMSTYLNGIRLSRIVSGDLFTIITNAWIGPVPPSREIKDALLGNVDSSASQSIFNSIEYLSQRRSEITSWNKPAVVAPPVKTIAIEESEQPAEVIVLPDKAVAQAKQKEAQRLAKESYAETLVVHAQSHIKYPRTAKWKKYQGQILAKVSVRRDGELMAYQLEKNTPHKSLNNAVMKGLAKASPYPAIPEIIADDEFTFLLPVSFTLK